jgi:2-dehydro-3-deoxyphosphogluconate aldolase/(4S)-4-hydroxy-2-oxoglutarate aldolase
MNENKFSWDLFNRMPVIGIIRNMSLDDFMQVLPLFTDVGLSTIEITMNTPNAEELIRYAVENHQGKLNVGAGTVCKKNDLKKALDAGAQFIVTPIVRKKLIRYCIEHEIPIFPGAFSPTEIYKAWTWGAPMIKVFPAKTLGPDYIRDVKAPLDQVKLLPTGGIGLDNIESFKKAGADGFGVGGPLFKKDLIKEKDWSGLKQHFASFVDRVKGSV